MGADASSSEAGENNALPFRDSLVKRLFVSPPATGEWTRFLFLRLLGVVQAFAFACAWNQVLPLVGSRGLLPAAAFRGQAIEALGSSGAAFLRMPSIFWMDAPDASLKAAAGVGFILAMAVALGLTNGAVQIALWVLQLSLLPFGQIFWGYGWEILLAETSFLAIFLAPFRSVTPFPATAASPAIFVLLRWLSFRVMFGAGLIKLRGDPCWGDLTCLYYHYETQPLPNVLSPFFATLPAAVQKASVLGTHAAEVVAPFGLLFAKPWRTIAGLSIIAFQIMLIVSGNFSFFNWLTIAITLSAFDDAAFVRLGRLRLPRPLGDALSRVRRHARAAPPTGRAPWLFGSMPWPVRIVVVVIGLLSINPIVNMLDAHQVMNTGFDPLLLVNSYGAFGSVERERREIILEATLSDDPDDDAGYAPYEFKCKPGDVSRWPCQVAPYQYRLDWQMWFAAMGNVERAPWLLHLVYKLLEGEKAPTSLLAQLPFGGARPRFVRARLYRYSFVLRPSPGGPVYRRTLLGPYLRPVAVGNPALRLYLQRYGLEP